MTDTTPSITTTDPGPRVATQLGFGIGLILGFLVALVALDFAGFELGKKIGAMQVNHQIDQATHEAVLYKATGYHNLREMIDDFEARNEMHLRLRRIEEDVLRARIEATAPTQ